MIGISYIIPIISIFILFFIINGFLTNHSISNLLILPPSQIPISSLYESKNVTFIYKIGNLLTWPIAIFPFLTNRLEFHSTQLNSLNPNMVLKKQFIFMGAPGSGKGTQAGVLAEVSEEEIIRDDFNLK